MRVKLQEATDPAFGKKPEERSAQELLDLGFVPLDKPCGPSSHEVSSFVKRIVGAEKTGHAGTLDPNVSGVLPVGINEATKVMGHLRSEKEYVGIMKFHKPVSKEIVERAFERFTGEITQLPPRKSAVARRERKRKVYYLRLLEYSKPDALFLVGCEAGTYVRKLCFDMGRFIGCGANMLELRRTKAGAVSEENLVTLQELSDAIWLWKEKNDETELRRCVRPIEEVLGVKKIILRDSAVEAICSGAQLRMPGIAAYDEGIEEGDGIALMSLKGELVALAQAAVDADKLVEEHGDAAWTVRVIMRSGTYPRMWKSGEPAKN